MRWVFARILAAGAIALATLSGCATVRTPVPPASYSALSPSRDYAITTTNGETHTVSDVHVSDSTVVISNPTPRTISFRDIESVETLSRKSVLYAEVGVEGGKSYGVEQQDFPELCAVGELGYISGELTDPKPHWGFGGTVLAVAAESNFRMGLKGRARYRFRPDFSLDLAAGPRLDPSHSDINGVIASVHLNFGSYFTVRSEWMKYNIDPWDESVNGVWKEHAGGDVQAWYNGIAVRGTPGWVGLGIGAAAFVAMTILVIATNGS